MQTERNIFWEVYNGLKHQGPGGDDYTEQALRSIPVLPPHTKVLDIGCGTGPQTLVLAKNLIGAEITALDINKRSLADLQQKAAAASLNSIIKAVDGSMFELPFEKESFDLIWSEGSIYIIGFKRGIQEWGTLLKHGGYFVASHLSWLSDDVPPDVREFWAKETEVLTIEENVRAIEAVGLEPTAQFVMPREGWWENYYAPIIDRLGKIRESDLTLEQEQTVNEIEAEIDLYEKNGSCYSYIFYIARNP